MRFEIHSWVHPLCFHTERRLDLIVKHRLWRHFLSGSDPEAERIYLEHIDKRIGAQKPLDSYIPAARELFQSMTANGFKGDPIPVNRDWQLLEGAHRTSLAYVLGLPLTIARLDTDHTWPAWGKEWFQEHMPDYLPEILEQFSQLSLGGHVTNTL